MDAGYELYSKKGVNDTTVGDITSAAGVAKGTFYLYFKDKFELHDRLVISKSSKLFVNAYQKLSHEVRINNNQELRLPENAILFMMKDILDVLKEDRDLLRFLHKDLALGIFNNFEENELLAEENPDFIAICTDKNFMFEILCDCLCHLRFDKANDVKVGVVDE